MQPRDTRRNFLQSAACRAAGLTGVVSLAGQTAAQTTGRGGAGSDLGPGPGRVTSGGPEAPAGALLRPASEIQVPKMKFGKVEISRLIAGCNPFYGFAHFNQTLAAVMREYYSAERVCDVLHQCT